MARLLAALAVCVAAQLATTAAADGAMALRGGDAVAARQHADAGLVVQAAGERKRHGRRHHHHQPGGAGSDERALVPAAGAADRDGDARFAVSAADAEAAAAARITGVECAMAASIVINVATTVTKAAVSGAGARLPRVHRPRRRRRTTRRTTRADRRHPRDHGGEGETGRIHRRRHHQEH